MLDVTRLRVLAAVARHGSVTAAARELHYTQPSVSHHLAKLEAETGAKLIQRAGRGIRLTSAGRLLAERAAEILGRLDSAETELAAHVGLRQGQVRLAAFPSALGTFIPAAAARLKREYPGLGINLVEAEPPEALRMLRAGYVDVAVAFRYDDTEPEDRGIRTTPLLEEPSYLVTGDDRDGTALTDHQDAGWIAGCDRCRSHLLDLCAHEGFTPTIAFTTDDYVAVQALVSAGMGVTVLPALTISAHRNPAVRFTRLPASPRYVFAATYGAPPDPPATTALLDCLRDEAAEAVHWPAAATAAQPSR
ncbi:LysR family transcriptional regulator [Bailinhaonella thermotolerans]|uniref:LysR family transcriptional regulator n=1 Tax=Bailinhaonella thermotolerans TaxID=1070861 RepID=A0A3A4APM2_9ACTN|nr:LysR family transcriptional regulator [Bailinhaonella thermotolerans]RJL30385.1 LysR family transcriptional regulator [Bailinhaonella thermotolerans]